LTDVACVAVTPEDPIVQPPTGSTKATLQLPTTPGLKYWVDAASGGGSTVSATLDDGYTWSPLPNQWTQVDQSTATFDLAVPTTPPDTSAPQVLASTGATALLQQLLAAAGLLVLGLALCRLGRRRPVT
jgi:hypothetical protein